MKRLLSMILCLALVLCGCTRPEPESPGTFYYSRTETAYLDSSGVLAPEERELAGISGNVEAIVRLYCAGPLSTGLENPLPPGTELLGYTLYDHVLTLRFNKALAELSGIELTVAAGCLARTFLPLTGAETLIITANGALLGSNPSMTLTLEDLSLRDDSLDLLHTEFPVFYASSDRKYLIEQSVNAHRTAPEELALHLLEHLLTPPAGSGLRSALPAGTRFLSVTLADGLCTVDVSQEFDSRRFYAMSAQCLSLLSIVNTLTTLEEIDRVEITVEGNLLIRYGSLSITEPLVRDERCVGPVRTGLGELEAVMYLVHGSESRLVAIPARLRPTAAATVPELLVRAILTDPGTNGIRSCISPGTRLLSVSQDNGICTVDLSGEYLDQPDQLVSSGRVIAASLCALEGIDGVRILVNGSVPAEFDAGLFGILVPEEDWFL